MHVCVSHFLYPFICRNTFRFFPHILATVNNAANEHESEDLIEIVIPFPLDIYPEMGLLDHMVNLFLIF